MTIGDSESNLSPLHKSKHNLETEIKTMKNVKNLINDYENYATNTKVKRDLNRSKIRSPLTKVLRGLRKAIKISSKYYEQIEGPIELYIQAGIDEDYRFTKDSRN